MESKPRFFPVEYENGMTEIQDRGITLSEWYAGQALASWKAPYSPDSHKDRATWAFDEAAAMMVERRNRMEVQNGTER
jgi:hypothetical protein